MSSRNASSAPRRSNESLRRSLRSLSRLRFDLQMKVEGSRRLGDVDPLVVADGVGRHQIADDLVLDRSVALGLWALGIDFDLAIADDLDAARAGVEPIVDAIFAADDRRT